MTRTLFLLRHAKSSWDGPLRDDFNRPLAARGRQDAARMGREMRERSWLPGLALISAAGRTVETWNLASAELPSAPEVEASGKLYHASPGTMIEALRSVPDAVADVILVGHNPGLEELAPQLAGQGSEGVALAALQEKFPTAGLARFSFERSWPELAPGGARLIHFLRPRDFA